MANKKFLSETNFWGEGGRCIKDIYWSATAVKQMCTVRGWYNNLECERDFNAMLNDLVYEHRHNPSRELFHTVAANIYAHTDPYPDIAVIRKEMLKTIGVVVDPKIRKKRENNKSYYSANTERICKKTKEYREAHPEEYAEYQRRYQQKNADRRREYQREWYRKKRLKDAQARTAD